MELIVEDALKGNFSFIDLRSQKEYGQSHIPFASSLPLLDDMERELVGRIYKQEGREKAVDVGLEHVLPRIEDLIVKINLATQNSEVVLYCARGGMRSQSVYKLFTNNPSVHLLIGGYKKYRNHFLTDLPRQIEKRNFIVFQGLTGVGKTKILTLLAGNYDVLDLEFLANHRGSVFGGLGLDEQPSQKQFENNIYHILSGFGDKVLIEAESSKIGRLILPRDLRAKMLLSPVFMLESPLESRIELLHEEYGAKLLENKEELTADIWKLKRQLGYNACEELASLVGKNEMKRAIGFLLVHYYDPLYQHSIKKNTDRVHKYFQSDTSDIIKEIGRSLDEILYT